VNTGWPRNPGLAPRVREAHAVLLATISVLPFEHDALRRTLKIVTHNARELVRVGGLELGE